MTSFLTLDEVVLKGQNVLLRLDLNMPFEGDMVRDTSRLEASMETLLRLREKGARTVIVTHMGRPNGIDPLLSVRKILPLLQEKLGSTVIFAETVDTMKHQISHLKNGEFILLENIRFEAGEEKNDPLFCKNFAEPFSIYVNEAFSVSHRPHASVYGAVTHIPLRIAGYHFLKEVSSLDAVFEDRSSEKPRHVVSIVGGSKVSTKIDLLENLCTSCDHVIVGGGMSNTFFVALGRLSESTHSMYEKNYLKAARSLMEKYEGKLVLPVDAVCAESIDRPTQILCADISNTPKTYTIVDMGPKSLEKVRDVCASAHIIVWNGPVGIFERPPFDQGTQGMIDILVELTKKGVTTLAGGGDTLAVLGKRKDLLSYVSTAGGAFLEYLEGKDLPGMRILRKHFG